MSGRISVLVEFPPELLVRVDAEAAAGKRDRMAAILDLIERGLVAVPSGGATDTDVLEQYPWRKL